MAQVGGDVAEARADVREQLHALRGAIRSATTPRGRAAIRRDHARYVLKRVPPGALPAEAWHGLVEGGTGLRKGDLLWAAVALAAHLDARPGGVVKSLQEWPTVADYLRETRNKPEGPWPMVVAEARMWHGRDRLRKLRRAARKKLKGSRPKQEPILFFGDKSFVVPVAGDEATLEGHASGHCLRGGTPGLHFSVRTPQNLPFFTGTYSVAANGSVYFTETKGNWNRIPAEHTAQARGAWAAVLAGRKFDAIGAWDDFLALWFPRPVKRGWTCLCPLDHKTSTTGQKDHGLSLSPHDFKKKEVAAAVPQMLELAAPGAVGKTFAMALEKARADVEHADGPLFPDWFGMATQGRRHHAALLRVWDVLVEADVLAAAAFLENIGEESAKHILGKRKNIPPAVALALTAREVMGTSRSAGWRKTLSAKDRAADLRRRVMELAPTWKDAEGLGPRMLNLWLALAPQRQVAGLFREWSVSDMPPGINKGVVAYRAARLSRRDLRAFLARHPAQALPLVGIRREAGEVSPDIQSVAAGETTIYRYSMLGPGETDERLRRRVMMMDPSQATTLVGQLTQCLEDNGDALERHQGYEGGRSEEELAEMENAAMGCLVNLWWVVNSMPEKIAPKELLEAISEGSWADSRVTENTATLIGPTEAAVSHAIAELALAGTLQGVRGWGLQWVSHPDPLFDGAIRDVLARPQLPLETRVAAARSVVEMEVFEETLSTDTNMDLLPSVRWATDHFTKEDEDTQATKDFADVHGLPYGPNLQAWVEAR